MDRALRPTIYSFALIGAGWAISAYLLLRQVTTGSTHLRWNIGIAAGSLCVGCDDALDAGITWARGVSLPGLGLVYFALVGLLLALGGRWATRLAFLLCAVGAGASLLFSAMLFGSGASACILCLAVHAANLALVAMLFTMVSRQLSGDSAKLGLLASAKGWLVVGLVAMVSSGLVHAAIVRPGIDAAKVLEQYRSSPQFEIPVQAGDPTLGPRDAPAQLVVFSSFQCPWCRLFAPSVKQLRERFGDGLAIVFKNFPLGKVCNSSLTAEMQPRACAAAWAAEAANLQERFWRYHDGLFADNQSDSDEMLLATARGTGLDLKRWEDDRQSKVVKLKVLADVQLGMHLGVDGTPTVFLNGRKIKNPTVNVLETLIKDVVRESAR